MWCARWRGPKSFLMYRSSMISIDFPDGTAQNAYVVCASNFLGICFRCFVYFVKICPVKVTSPAAFGHAGPSEQCGTSSILGFCRTGKGTKCYREVASIRALA